MMSKIQKTSHGTIASREKRLGLNERLALINLMDESSRLGGSDSPFVSDLFRELGDLVDLTVSGARVDRLKSESNSGFKILEVNSESGENMGRLNMLYLNKPIPCYYLVYVEIAPPFRRKGLGNVILQAFRDFLIEKSAVGLLDNIIPQDDPTYDIYLKLDWKSVEEVTGLPSENYGGVYMVFIPPSTSQRDLKGPLIKLLHHLKRRRAAIDMRDNELMVQRTIEEFKDLYSALTAYFEVGSRRGENDSFMRFMFTRYITKLLGFGRRISQLLGYTGGESLEQIVLDKEIRDLPIQSYAPRYLNNNTSFMTGDRELWLALPEELKNQPARYIESLPCYQRPSLITWIRANARGGQTALTIGDILDIGFDPTRLKEFSTAGENYIFERIQTRFLDRVSLKKDTFDRLQPQMAGSRIKGASFGINPPLLVIRDRGNGYILRNKIDGIHWEEALEQTQTDPVLKAMNSSTKLDKVITATVKKARSWLQSRLDPDEQTLLDDFAFFVSWNLEQNQPKLVIDFSGSYLEAVWVA